MKKFLALTALVLLILVKAPLAQAAGLEFQDYEVAMKRAAAENKYVMFFFWADWCRYCTQIRQEVFQNDKVTEAFDKSFVGVSVDVENDKGKLAEQYKASKVVPTITFLKPNGEVVGYFDGAVSPEVFIELLEHVKKGGS